MRHAFLPAVLISLLACSLGWGGFYQVGIDVTALAGREMDLGFSLYNLNDVAGESSCLIRNIRLDGAPALGTLGDWYSQYDPRSLDLEVTVDEVGGSVRIVESAGTVPVIAARRFDFRSTSPSLLSFDIETAVGPDDEFDVDMLDWTGDTEDRSILFAFTVYDNQITASPETTVVPAPAALLLGLLGFGAGGLGLRRGRSHLI